MSVRQLLIHIALSTRMHHEIHAISKRSTFEGFDFPAFMKQMGAEAGHERNKTQIVELLKTEGEVWATFLEGVSDDFLAEPFTTPPGSTPATKCRLEMLLSVKEHEMHHRAQVMVAQRLLGIVPHLTRDRQEHLARTEASSNA